MKCIILPFSEVNVNSINLVLQEIIFNLFTQQFKVDLNTILNTICFFTNSDCLCMLKEKVLSRCADIQY